MLSEWTHVTSACVAMSYSLSSDIGYFLRLSFISCNTCCLVNLADRGKIRVLMGCEVHYDGLSVGSNSCKCYEKFKRCMNRKPFENCVH